MSSGKYPYTNETDTSNQASRAKFKRSDTIYSCVIPPSVIPQSSAESTEPVEMNIKQSLLMQEILTVKDIIHRLTERNLTAWRALPESIRDRMLDRPSDFHLIENVLRKDGDFDYNIEYNKVIWRYSTVACAWVVHELI